MRELNHDRVLIKEVVEQYGEISIQELKKVMAWIGWGPDKTAAAVRNGFDYGDLETGKRLWIKIKGEGEN